MIAVTASLLKSNLERWSEWMQKQEDWDLPISINGAEGMVTAFSKAEAVPKASASSVIAFMHDDCELLEPCHDRILQEFDDPKVAIVGLGGATGIGVPDIYKLPYKITQLQRINYYSNQVGWNIHGAQEIRSRDVAVVDGFFMAIRTKFLNEIGGWSWFPYQFHCYDTCMCLMAHRRRWKVRMVGVKCNHHGGGTSTSVEYLQWCKDHNTTPELEHSRPHEWMYESFRDLLPLRV